MSQKTLTILTPTYNRAHLLQRGYDALCRQTSRDFLWLVVDDGSTDDTRDVVEKWQKEADFEIRYAYKQNGGLYTGYNKAIELSDTELMVCIDSDDYMPDDGVETICRFWQENKSPDVAGIVGLDYDLKGNCMGDFFPNVRSINPIDILLNTYHLRDADRKYVVRTDLYKSVAPMEEIEGEKDFNPQYLHVKLGFQYEFLVLNRNLCFVEYQENGMTKGIFKQYLKSPKSFMKLRLFNLSLPGSSVWYKFKNILHYIAECILIKEKHPLKKSPYPFATFCLFPLGLLLLLYIKYKAR